MDFLFTLLVFALVGGLIYWLLTMLPIKEPFKQFVLAVFIVICIIWLVGTFFGWAPVPHYHVYR